MIEQHGSSLHESGQSNNGRKTTVQPTGVELVYHEFTIV